MLFRGYKSFSQKPKKPFFWWFLDIQKSHREALGLTRFWTGRERDLLGVWWQHSPLINHLTWCINYLVKWKFSLSDLPCKCVVIDGAQRIGYYNFKRLADLERKIKAVSYRASHQKTKQLSGTSDCPPMPHKCPLYILHTQPWVLLWNEA